MSNGIAPWLEKSQWPTVPIRLLARLGTGHTPSRSNPEYWHDCTIPWITLADVWQLRSGTTTVISDTKEKISRLGLANSAAVLHPAGTVILSRTASVGFSAIMGSDMATSQDFATWTCGTQLEPRYLLHALRGMAPDLKRVATGSTHKTIYMPDIEQLRVPLPPQREQQRIANFLDAQMDYLDRLATLDSEVLSRLDERKQALRDSAIDQLSKRHGNLPLRRLMRCIEQGTSPRCEATPRQGPEEWGVLKLSSVKNGSFNPNENKRLPTSVPPPRMWQVNEGDLLVTRANTPRLVGDVAVATGDCTRLLLPDLIYRIKLRTDIDPHFVAQVSLGSQIRQRIEATARGSSQSMVKLRGEDIRSWPVPNAPLRQQQEFTQSLLRWTEPAETLRAALNQRSQLLTERRQALITAAVTGQFDVSTASGRGVAP
ncbi:restriction endonuclease subunit S [Streptodolium elevatio]|uniref:Restriction endonuclease subunit S n=1 Tax=Streptodolium elevatio TaxID=3157996 RepID=A0ABV3DUP9_9ACTN